MTMTQTKPTGRLAEVEVVVREYHSALDRREHGDIACHRAMEKIEAIMGLEWRAGAADR